MGWPMICSTERIGRGSRRVIRRQRGRNAADPWGTRRGRGARCASRDCLICPSAILADGQPTPLRQAGLSLSWLLLSVVPNEYHHLCRLMLHVGHWDAAPFREPRPSHSAGRAMEAPRPRRGTCRRTLAKGTARSLLRRMPNAAGPRRPHGPHTCISPEGGVLMSLIRTGWSAACDS